MMRWNQVYETYDTFKQVDIRRAFSQAFELSENCVRSWIERGYLPRIPTAEYATKWGINLSGFLTMHECNLFKQYDLQFILDRWDVPYPDTQKTATKTASLQRAIDGFMGRCKDRLARPPSVPEPATFWNATLRKNPKYFREALAYLDEQKKVHGAKIPIEKRPFLGPIHLNTKNQGIINV